MQRDSKGIGSRLRRVRAMGGLGGVVDIADLVNHPLLGHFFSRAAWFVRLRADIDSYTYVWI